MVYCVCLFKRTNDNEGGTIMRISDSIVYVGVFDRDIDLFEGQYQVPTGVSYNSYIIF